MKRKAVAFLTKHPQLETLAFAEEIAYETDFDVYIFSDELYMQKEKYVITPTFKVISISDEKCRDANYINSNISDNQTHIKKNPIAWDKMLYYLCEIKTEYDTVWVFEDDVFIPNFETILNLDKKYDNFDLVTPNNFLKSDTALDWHWQHIMPKIDPPYYFSMVCACKLSDKMLNCVKEYVKTHQQLFYIEVIFNTLAMQNNLNVTDALELKSVVWQGEWGMDEFILLPNNVFHPKKNIEDYFHLRMEIDFNKKNGFKPINKLPKFITDLL
jgi:hypothetical protein